MTRKRRKTRSRQERRRIHERTRQTRAQAITRYVEGNYAVMLAWSEREHPFVTLMKKRNADHG